MEDSSSKKGRELQTSRALSGERTIRGLNYATVATCICIEIRIGESLVVIAIANEKRNNYKYKLY